MPTTDMYFVLAFDLYYPENQNLKKIYCKKNLVQIPGDYPCPEENTSYLQTDFVRCQQTPANPLRQWLSTFLSSCITWRTAHNLN